MVENQHPLICMSESQLIARYDIERTLTQGDTCVMLMQSPKVR